MHEDPPTKSSHHPARPDGENSHDAKPVIDLGFLLLTETDGSSGERINAASEQLQDHLARQLPDFDWVIEVVTRPMRTQRWRIDPLELFELGVQEKVERGWDFAFVITERELVARDRAFVYGVPSSTLETAVISLARTHEDPGQVVDVAQFLLGSMLGLGPNPEGAMLSPDPCREPAYAGFSETELTILRKRLGEIGDARLEELEGRWSAIGFRWQTFRADPRGILKDLAGNRPWLQPFRLGKLTAAAFVATLLSFLGSEVWELGVSFEGGPLIFGVLLSIASASWFLFRGQNFAEVTRHQIFTEQMARTELVLKASILIGMATLWLLLALSAFAIASALPETVIENWISADLDLEARLRFAAFVSTIGTLAGALGGNLEEESDFKARFFFDEEV